jgi:hypothetical protein
MKKTGYDLRWALSLDKSILKVPSEMHRDLLYPFYRCHEDLNQESATRVVTPLQIGTRCPKIYHRAEH